MHNLDTALANTKTLEDGLKESVIRELVSVRQADQDVKVWVHESGFVVYRRGDSNFVLATVHNGSHVPKGVKLKQGGEERKKEEDLHTSELYMPLFLVHGGHWISCHVSRYFVDLNRPWDRAILSYGSEGESNLATKRNKREIEERAAHLYGEFYRQAALVMGQDSYVFSGHSMCDRDNRGDFCLIYAKEREGWGLRRCLRAEGFSDVRINDPFVYEGGHFRKFADCFAEGRSVELETNKGLYMDEKTFVKKPEFNEVSMGITRAVTQFLKA